MENRDTKLRIVRLLEPSLCLSCRYAAIATVEMANGTNRRMLHCKRLDCDNWETEETEETPRSLYDGD
jgi:hypothetical protein